MPKFTRSLLMATLAALLLTPAWAASGTLTASPNPCAMAPGAKLCTTYLTWSASGKARVWVRNLTRGDEKEFSATSHCQRCAVDWIKPADKYVFTLYDFSSGSRGRALSSVTVTAAEAR